MGVLLGERVLVSFRGTCHGQRIILTQTYRVAVADTPDNTYAEAMAGLIDKLSDVNEMRSLYMACLPPQYTLNAIRAQVVSPVRAVFIERAQIGVIGTNAESGQFTNTSAAITLRTNLSGRKQIATKHIGPIPNDAVAAGSLDALYRTALSNLQTSLLNDVVPAGFDTATYRPIILHRASAPALFTSDDITSGIVQTTSRVMRRRTVGLGE